MIRLLIFVLGLCAYGADNVLQFDPTKTAIHWTLGTVLHTVHGTFQLKSGTIHFDPTSGAASGQLIVNALSGESGSEARDNRMKQSILEAPKFTDIIFTPDKVVGQIAPQGKSTIQVHGSFTLHGTGHDFTMPVEVDMKSDGEATTKAHFSIPYIKWGLKNPSTFVLRVNDSVDVEIEATARIAVQ